MSSLDLPQHRFVCSGCNLTALLDGQHRKCSGPGRPCCCSRPVKVEPTLLYADFQAYVTALSLAFDPMPRDADVWDRLESCTDTAPSNREAIDNAIRWVVSEQ